MNDILFTDRIYELLIQQRDWPAVLGRTLMAPDAYRAKMLRVLVFDMFDLQAEDFTDKSDCGTMMACILYGLSWQHMVDRMKQDVLK